MTVLVIQIPPRERVSARSATGAATASAAPAVEGYAWVLSPDGLQITSQGRATAHKLPRADTVVAVLSESDVSWQRITLPLAPAARLRAALGGVLEENLLDDDDTVHLALAPQAVGGQSVWVAVMNKAWLAGELAGLEKAGCSVERVVPALWPGDTPQGHFYEGSDASGAAHTLLAFADDQGLTHLRLSGTLARALMPRLTGVPARWTATPAVAAPAERWLGAALNVVSEAERMLQSSRSLWNLRQFELAPQHRGTRALSDAFKRFMSPGWRPVRIGLAALAGLQLLGLNAWAWHERSAIGERRAAMESLLRSTHPQVRAVLDAPAQMQRETESLRAAAGRVGDGDLEALLGAAAMAWPEAVGPVQSMRFEPGRLTLAASGWPEAQVAQFRERLRLGGWAVEAADGRLTLSRAAPGRGGS